MSFRRTTVKYVEGDKIPAANIWKASIEKYAEEVAEVIDFQPGGDLIAAIDGFGGELHYRPMDEWVDEDGSIFVHEECDFDILLPSYTSPLRDRFTIAHELGHYFLHSEQGVRPIIAFRRGSTRIEWEANWFAASFLMPREEFDAREADGYDIPDLAAYFSVSERAAEVRRDSK